MAFTKTETLYYVTSGGKYYTQQYSGEIPGDATARVCVYGERTVSATAGGYVRLSSISSTSSPLLQSLSFRQYKYGGASIRVYGAFSGNRSVQISYGDQSVSASASTGGYELVGWYDTYTKERYAKTSPYAIDADLDDVNITAVFGVKFTVYFKKNGGSGDESKAYWYCYNGAGEWYIRNAPNASKWEFSAPAGKCFDCWNTQADGSGRKVYVGDDLSVLSEKSGATVNLYAQWKPLSKLTIENPKSDIATLVLKDEDGNEIAREQDGVLDAGIAPGEQYHYYIDAEVNETVVDKVRLVDQSGVKWAVPFWLTPEDGKDYAYSAEVVLKPLHSVTTVFNSERGTATISPEPDYEGKWIERDITISVKPNPGYMATTYKINSSAAVDIPSSGNIFIPAEDVTKTIQVYINFVAAEFTVYADVEKPSKARGTATSSRSGFVAEDEVVVFSAAVADPMFTFEGWYLKDGTLKSADNPYSLTVKESTVLYARFSVEEKESTMSVSYGEGSEGLGFFAIGYRDNSPTGSDRGANTISYTADNGSSVVISAMVESGCSFVGWYENGTLISSLSTITTFVKDGRHLEARFDAEGGSVYEWEGSTENKMLTWRSKTYVSPRPFNPSVVRIDTLGYPLDSVKVEMFSAPDSEPTAKSELTNVESQTVRRLPIRRMERYVEVEVCNRREVDAVFLGTSAGGIGV